MTAPPHRAPAEASLIRVARQARGLSPEAAAQQAPIRLGGSRWREIEKGYKGTGRQPVIAPDLTLAHMARVVGVTPERLDDVGRDTAAEILREILRQEAESDQAPARPYADMSDRLERTAWEMPLPVEERKLIVDMLREAKAQGRQERSA
ncbi:hypothetical protein ACKI1S_05935 [Streptomyces galilaeus]|uniref:XRE family transcriptional regulator n=1 Tax=Streptomyces galilaeus TaxID=33899 RepID=A0ABW9ICW8_STRGJ